MMTRLLRLAAIATASLFLAACGSSVRTVPLTVQSEPLGAYVMFQVQADRDEERSYDWIYLGNTPLKVRHSVTKKELDDADAFVIRVMKEGYHEQKKAYTGDQMVTEAKSKGTVFWNPILVPSN